MIPPDKGGWGVAFLNPLFSKEGWGDLYLGGCCHPRQRVLIWPSAEEFDIFACITVHLAQFSRKTRITERPEPLVRANL